MSIKGIGNLLTGGGLDFIGKGLDFVNKRWPPKMSEDDKAQMQVVLKDMLHQQAMDIQQAAHEDEKQFNERTIALEGTAKDLQSVPFVGSVVIFLRGAFRPLFSYFTAFLDFQYFMAGMTWTDRQESLLLAINLLVLGFFFGERAMKNVLPLLAGAFAAKAGESK